MLESTSAGEVRVSTIIRGGSAHENSLREGDVIESVDDEQMIRNGGVERVSCFIRGPSGSFVTLGLRQPSGNRIVLRIQRRAVPGGTAEILGTLFQGTATSVSKREVTVEDRIAKLKLLQQRGNLSDEECKAALKRLLTGTDTPISIVSFAIAFG